MNLSTYEGIGLRLELYSQMRDKNEFKFNGKTYPAPPSQVFDDDLGKLIREQGQHFRPKILRMLRDFERKYRIEWMNGHLITAYTF